MTFAKGQPRAPEVGGSVVTTVAVATASYIYLDFSGTGKALNSNLRPLRRILFSAFPVTLIKLGT